MALSSGVRTAISRAPGTDVPMKVAKNPGVLWAALMTALVSGPWLAPGYLFGTDWPGPRRLDFVDQVASWAPFQDLLAAIALMVGAEITAKLLMLGIIFGASVSAFNAVPVDGFVPRAAASALYLLNPFVYGRLHYGQIFLLAGYAALPWLAWRLRLMLEKPSARNGLLAGLAGAVIGVLSLHTFLMAAMLSAIALLAAAGFSGLRLDYLRKLAIAAAVAGAVALAISAYWVVPLLEGVGAEGTQLAGIGQNAIIEFRTVPDPHLGLVPNLLGLYGFWAEDAGRFLSMKTYLPPWPAALATVLLVSGVGVATAIRRRQMSLAPWVVGLVLAGLVALVLAMGASDPTTSRLTTWLDSHFSPYRGLRDAGKWVAILALAYSQLFGLGAAALLDWLRAIKLPAAGKEGSVAVTSALLLAIPIGYGNGLLFGSHQGIQPSQYPAGWYAADRLLLADPHPGRTLFLPWHEYLSFDFIRNENRVIACPAPAFFSTPVLASANPEVFGISPPTDPDQVAISDLVGQGPMGDWARVLADHGVKYALLARTVDWQSYEYLDSLPNFTKVADFGSIVVYRDLLSP